MMMGLPRFKMILAKLSLDFISGWPHLNFSLLLLTRRGMEAEIKVREHEE